ncbi:uncharacterized protein LOC129892851 [Solanum dulcamara]|uniref:uncharacterized protein LOC129892851 n=1 Tax=Solanum dulcamara TaxID=45834 RepID=UPI0024863A3D|nr:uncharacterized protein LOC129892851 [Solanum dulcamara]
MGGHQGAWRGPHRSRSGGRVDAQGRGAQAHFYAAPTRVETEASDDVITGLLKSHARWVDLFCSGLEVIWILGAVVSKDGIMADPMKIEAIHDRARPTSMTEIHSFARLIGYYKHFVEGFSTIAAPLTRLTR